MGRKKIAVLMGGKSPEHEISLLSGRSVLARLDRERFAGRGVVISRHEGLWSVFGEEEEIPAGTQAYRGGLRPEHAAAELRAWGADAAFLALHGPFGEDGSMQGFFQIMGIPFTGPGVGASAVAIDKPTAKAFLVAHGIRTLPHLLVDRESWEASPQAAAAEIGERIGFPCFLKPTRLGSSVGVARAAGPGALEDAMATALGAAGSAAVMVERGAQGREVSCGVLGQGLGARALPPVEIRPRNSEFFDIRAKYEEGASEEICPAPIGEDATRSVCEAALRIHRLVGARGFSRSDFILGADGLWFLEVNTIPGLTPQSILPRAAAAAGISFTELVTRIIESALEPEV